MDLHAEVERPYQISFCVLISCVVLTVSLLLLLKFHRGNVRPRFNNGKKLRYPPGPWKLPILGYMPFLIVNPYKALENLGWRYGSIFSIYLGGYRVVVLNDYHVIREAFKEEAFSGRPDLKMLEVRNAGVRKGLVCSEGRTWTEQRKFTLRHLKDLGFGKQSTMETLIQEEMLELIQNIKKHVGQPIDLLSHFQLAVLNSLWKITCGERYNHGDTRLLDILKKTGADLADTQYTGPILFLPWLVQVAPGLTRWNSFVNSITTVHSFLKGKIHEHIVKFSPDTLNDFIDHYLTEIRKTSDVTSSFHGENGEHSLLVTLLDLFMAGADTTSTTLYWAFLFMVLHNNVQVKVQKEIDSVVGSSTPSLGHRKRMPYTEATIKEILRKSSLVPLGLFHSTTEDTEFFGYDIPKDTVIIANLHNCHNNKLYWQDPDNFRPERFLESGKFDSFLPFSTGKRICPGEALAKDELFLFLVALLQNFSFTYDPRKPIPSEKPKIGIVLSPKPYSIIANERVQITC